MINYHRTFCGQCKDVTLHFNGECMRHQKTELEQQTAWDSAREDFRVWMATLNFTELMEVARDVSKMMEYEQRRIEMRMNRESLLDKMKHEFERKDGACL